VGQPVCVAREKACASSWRQPSLTVLSRSAATLDLVLEIRRRAAA